jgi:hypothetical protein
MPRQRRSGDTLRGRSGVPGQHLKLRSMPHCCIGVCALESVRSTLTVRPFWVTLNVSGHVVPPSQLALFTIGGHVTPASWSMTILGALLKVHLEPT